MRQLLAVGLSALMLGQASAVAAETPAADASASRWTLAQSTQSMPFPFTEVQNLSPEETRIQKYKLQRLRIQQVRQEWQIIRGINEKIDDQTLLKMIGENARLREITTTQLIGNSISIGGLVLAGAGGIVMTDIVRFEGSVFVGLGMIVTGIAAVIAGEYFATNMFDFSGHILERREAEDLVKAYNAELKRELRLEHLKELD
ncbi:MAG: hypothetical protein IGS03_05175 [Candidatus Sericytochromatia bacterium]|nr:hypothetical protein [Candidatus Sericytochromatia bacterium]